MNTITHILPWIQLVLSVLMVVLVLLQRSADGIDGSAFGGSGGNMTYFARRGAERFLFVATIVVAVLLTASTLVALAF
ncbi:MAG: Preprotein translocase, SecG subunit [Patescibacteria group bacterium]|nr:Preprotein translocase, SecG subunit [Patescibacteria group bacterium]